MAAVEVRNLVKAFGRTLAVRGVSFSVDEGEIFGLLGPNGSGKTTTLLVMATVYRPTSGDVYIYGRSVSREGDLVRRYVGIAFQDPKALWVDKPYDLLLWHARVVGLSASRAREAVREVMEALGLWEFRNRRFYQLSGGTRKKVEVAKVLIQRPRVAILDEPTAQVDVVSKHAMWDAIRGLREDGAAVIVATNDMFEAERVCGRLAVMYRGELKAVGTVAELKDAVPQGDVVEVALEGDESAYARAESLLAEYGRVAREDGLLRVFLDRGEEKVVGILDLLRSRGFRVRKVMVREPTLDDAFFYITGARLGG